MNPAVKILHTILVTINGIINGLSRQTVDTIRRSYFLVVFVGIVIAGVIAWNAGTKSASIKSPPLAPETNSVFETEMNREREFNMRTIMEEDPKLSSPLSSNMSKLSVPSREKEGPDTDNRIIDTDTKKMKPGDKNFIFQKTPEKISDNDVRMLDRTEEESKKKEKKDDSTVVKKKESKKKITGKKLLPVEKPSSRSVITDEGIINE
jgi:hypothetical protein